MTDMKSATDSVVAPRTRPAFPSRYRGSLEDPAYARHLDQLVTYWAAEARYWQAEAEHKDRYYAQFWLEPKAGSPRE